MALDGKFTSYQEMNWSGKVFVLVTLEYNGKPWENLSTFDSDLIEEVKKCTEGQDITFETKKSKKYTNLIMLNDVTAKGGGNQVSADGGKPASTGGGGWKKDTDKEIFGKTLTQLLNGFCAGGKIPTDAEVAQLGAIADAVTKGKYFKE